MQRKAWRALQRQILFVVCTHSHFMPFISLSRRCMKIPLAVKIMGPNSSPQDLDHAAHEHVFECSSRCPTLKTPGNSSLFPTEHAESSEWIVAWHAMKNIEKALAFLRANVSAVTRDAVMKCPEVATMFADAATIVRDRLKARPQDAASLEVPGLSTDSDVEEPYQPILIDDQDYDFAEEEDDEDDVFVLRNGRPQPVPPALPAHLPPAQRAAVHVPPAQRAAQPRVDFDEEVQFVMDAASCNRRAAVDALQAFNTAHEAILWLLD